MIYIDQIIHSSIRYAKLKANSNLFSFFYTPCIIEWISVQIHRKTCSRKQICKADVEAPLYFSFVLRTKRFCGFVALTSYR